MKKIYCLSGLGADERIFKNLSVHGAELIHLAWLPFSKQDSLSDYAAKMSGLIDENDPVILGLSFGGMLAIEIAKLRPVQKVFLISSAKTKHELPGLWRGLRLLVHSEILPSFFYNIPNSYIHKLFGARTKEEKKLLSNIIRDADGHFVKRALRAISEWQNETVPQSVIHIHGADDKILPSQRSKPDYWIEGGTHLMVYNRAEEISRIIEKELGL
jgi:pimeloyl-ACP methyl ester carboxylesterase